LNIVHFPPIFKQIIKMKKTIYTFCAGVFALLTIIGCSKSDDNDSKKNKDKTAE